MLAFRVLRVNWFFEIAAETVDVHGKSRSSPRDAMGGCLGAGA